MDAEKSRSVTPVSREGWTRRASRTLHLRREDHGRRPHREDHIEAIAQGKSYREPGISNVGTVGNRADRTSACLLTVPAFCCGGRETGKIIFINAAYNTQHNSDDSDRQKGYFKSRVMWYNEHRLTKYEENVIFPMIFVLQGKQ